MDQCGAADDAMRCVAGTRRARDPLDLLSVQRRRAGLRCIVYQSKMGWSMHTVQGWLKRAADVSTPVSARLTVFQGYALRQTTQTHLADAAGHRAAIMVLSRAATGDAGWVARSGGGGSPSETWEHQNSNTLAS